MARVLISGASGFIGSHLVSFLGKENDVFRLVRKKEDSQNTIYWNPEKGEVQKPDLENFDVVIHLSGENITGRWTKKKKKKIFESRVVTTWFLSQILTSLYRPPKVLICASAIGFYGNREKEVLTEKSSPGKGFLAHVGLEWEKAARSISNRGTRVIHTRFGIVLGKKGGVLSKMLPIFRLGLGGKIGSGKQYFSWVSIDDVVRAIQYAIDHDEIDGPLNVVSCEPIPFEKFVKTLAHVLHRPAFCHMPSWAAKFIFGKEMAEETVLASVRAIPEKLLNSGFSFQDTDLEKTLEKLK